MKIFERRNLIVNLKENINERVYIKGWVHRIRKLKTISFIIIKDRTGFVQCVVNSKTIENLKLTLESVVEIEGIVKENANKLNNYEVEISSIKVINFAEENLPIQVNKTDLNEQLDTILNNRVLSFRNEKERAIFKIQNALSASFTKYLRENDFLEIHTPKIVKEGAEGGANVFKLNYFGEDAFLAQSPQFYKQMMVIAGFERVFEVGPVFRAESHSTNRHLNEYTSMDLEIGFVEDEYILMALETELLNYMFKYVFENCKTEIKLLNINLPKIEGKIPRMKLSEAIALYNKNNNQSISGDLTPEAEKYIGEYILKTTGSEFLFLTHYPQSKRPMYTMPEGELETRSFDLLFKGLEITTGGLRIHNLEQLKKQMGKKNLKIENYEMYLEAFKIGAPPHGGLAIGLERLTKQLIGFKNIRRTCLFPRDGQRLLP